MQNFLKNMINKTPEPTRLISDDERMIGIVGGVGPEAGTLLHRFIIEETAKLKKVGRDQDHLLTHHISASPWITDRTNFLLGEHDQNSAEGVARVIKIFDDIAKSQDRKFVAGVPCNTFHAPPIFNHLEILIEQHGVENVEILHMIQETKNYIEENFQGVQKIGLMSTTGTKEQRIYHDLLEPLGYEVIEVDEADQANLHDTIYNSEWGIKAVSPVSEQAKNNFELYAKQLQNKGAEALILGCTEIPIALPGNDFEGTPLIDPMRALARALVARAIG